MLRAETQGAVLRLTINRPEVRNAFNDELIAALTQAFRNVSPEIRAVVLSGEGPGFCAGGDLQWMARAASYTFDQNVDDAMKLAALFESIIECRAIVVAKVHGAAFGGGCGLVAASDVAIALADTKFAFSEVKLGLIPGTISRVVVPKIGAGHARALFSTGEVFDPEHALRIGLIHGVAATPEALDEMLDKKLKAILAAGPEAAYHSKMLAMDSPLTAEDAAIRLAEARAGAEGREGVAAFLEKRKASFVADWPK